ncbi:hypothetical protein [Accumulibacter sp.]|uniref:hypothetical protein n=1 Tax=Accumulibacter sp. TaxID=2053492 RepID=UPI0025DD96C6|nr:hypothetical protein [Accumulibacter sp.]MCM8594194.1 hypothetical protein [Accumulibacter sp.]MCM8625758.1 hypothetical protein [Accumulibacter sp.]MDS4048337.1 hypothetical protein [Accumulibacter sp.]
MEAPRAAALRTDERENFADARLASLVGKAMPEAMFDALPKERCGTAPCRLASSSGWRRPWR